MRTRCGDRRKERQKGTVEVSRRDESGKLDI